MRKLPVVKTKYLFLILLRILKPNVVFDVGSLNGSDALRFRRMLPDAKVVAFEANPYLYQKLIHDRALKLAGVSIINKAVSASEADEIPFFVAQESIRGIGNKGTSSIYCAAAGDDNLKIVVQNTRLDEQLDESRGITALWIDVEEAAYEVLSTIRSKQNLVDLMHIETEKTERWKGHKNKSEVVALAQSMGFAPIAQSSDGEQQDVVFVKQSILKERRFQVALAVSLTKISGPLFARIFEFDARLHRGFS